MLRVAFSRQAIIPPLKKRSSWLRFQNSGASDSTTEKFNLLLGSRVVCSFDEITYEPEKQLHFLRKPNKDVQIVTGTDSHGHVDEVELYVNLQRDYYLLFKLNRDDFWVMAHDPGVTAHKALQINDETKILVNGAKIEMGEVLRNLRQKYR